MKDLPDSHSWNPHEDDSSWLSKAYLTQCSIAESNITIKHAIEKQKNIYPFDSGTSLEEIVAIELKSLFSKRYLITKGKVSDSSGKTAGHCDLLFFNDLWFPVALTGSVNNSDKHFFPIDGIYAVGEIKSKLTDDTLDKAFEKLVKCARLNRPRTKIRRLVENRESSDCIHGLSNPLYTFIIAEATGDRDDFQPLIQRFVEINRGLKRLEMVRSLCVLGKGSVFWSFLDANSEMRPARFMEEDLYRPLIPTFIKASDDNPALYSLIANLQLHLFHSVLAAEDFAYYYGNKKGDMQFAKQEEFHIPPDKEWIESLKIICKDDKENHGEYFDHEF